MSTSDDETTAASEQLTEPNISHQRAVPFPNGQLIGVNDVLALARIAADATTSIEWRLLLEDRSLDGRDLTSLRQALTGIDRNPKDFWITCFKWGPSEMEIEGTIRFSFHWNPNVAIKGTSLDWVAGKKERFEMEMRNLFPRPRARSQIPLVAGTFLGIVIIVGAGAWLNNIGVNLHPGAALIGLGVWLVATATMFANVFSFSEPTPAQLAFGPASAGRAPYTGPWYHHPIAEAVRVIAPAIAALWALLQIALTLSNLTGSLGAPPTPTPGP